MRKRVIQLVSVTLALGALLWLLHNIGWGTIGAALVRVGWHGMILLSAVTLLECVLDGASLWIIMGPPLRIGYAIAVNSAGAMLNLIIPWESGEVLKGGLLRRHFASANAISGTIIWNYIFKISRPTVSALTAVLAAFLCRHVVSSWTIRIVLLANAGAFLPYLGLRLLIRWGAAAGLLKLLAMIPVVRRHTKQWVELARHIDTQIRAFWHERPADYLKVFVLQAVARATGWASIYACFRFLGLPYTFAQATLVYATMNVAEYVIAILPARVGVPEGTAFFAFKFLGMDSTLGVIVYVILRVRGIAASGLLTPFAFFELGR
jgi:hypothetical protein